MEKLLKFKFKDLEYGLCYDGKQSRYYVLENGIMKYNLTEEQKGIVDSVIDQVIPTGSNIRLPDLKFNGNNYQVYYNKKTGLKLFEPRNNIEDLYKLYYIFNNFEGIYQENFKYGDKLEERYEKLYFKRAVKVGLAIVMVDISLAMSLYTSIPNYVVSSTIDKIDNEITSIMPDEMIFDRVKAAVVCNPNLSDEEKQLILLKPEVFINNKEYLHFNYLEDTLANLNIEYIADSSDMTNNERIIYGAYRPSENTIYFYDVKSCDDVRKSSFYHEFSHVLTKVDVNFNSFLIETSNAIFNSENYYGDESYSSFVPYAKALMEITGAEPLKKYHGFSDIKIITDSLCEIIDDEDKALAFLTNLDTYKTISSNYVENMDNIFNLQKEIYQQFGEYYYAKYGKNMEDDLIMLYYLDGSKFRDFIKDNYYMPEENQIVEIEVLHGKKYFNVDNDNDNEFVIKYSVYNTEYVERLIPEIDEDGNEILIDDSRNVKTDLAFSTEIVINDTNRYINSSSKRMA